MKRKLERELIGRHAAKLVVGFARCPRCQRVGNHARWCNQRPGMKPTEQVARLLSTLAAKRSAP